MSCYRNHAIIAQRRRGDNRPDGIVDVIRWDEKAGLRADAIRSQVIDALEAQDKGNRQMKKISIARAREIEKVAAQRLAVGLAPL